MTAPQPKRFRGDAGFTLPEVLMTVVMLGIIMTAIAGALLVTIGPDQQAADRMISSHDGQLLALHLPQDLQSASPTVADTAPGATLACTGAVAGTNVLRLAWAEQGTTYAVSYRVVDTTDERQLVRYACTNGGAVSRLVVAHDLGPGGSAATAAVDGSVVSITVTERTGRTFTVSGSRRTPDNECRVTDFSLAYTELPLGDPAGHLSEDVLVTIELIGPCSGVALRVAYTPNGGAATLALGSSGTPRSATIGKNAHTWSVGDETFEIQRVDGQPIESPVAVLTLTEYVLPCVVETMTATPDEASLDATSHLDQDITVEVTTSGPCADLELLFSTTEDGPDQPPISLGSAAPYTATIPQDAYVWEEGERELRVRELATGDELDSTEITINPYVCAVESVTPNGGSFPNTGGNNNPLAAPLTVTVVTTGPCEDLELRFRPRNPPSTQTVDLVEGPAGTWTYTIPGNGQPGAVDWSDGFKTLTVLIDGDLSPTTGGFTVT